VVFELFDLDNDGFISADDCRCAFLSTKTIFVLLQD
jgi:Ca2+-binding EF-hand superfamily protein